MLVPGRAEALSRKAAVMRSVSACVRPVTLDVLYIKLDLGPVPFTKVALVPVLLLLLPPAPVAAGVFAGVLLAVLLPPPFSLQLPGSLLLSVVAAW